ncbi:helix-turn-helix domain-containing protein [Gordonia jinghuaiqii]|uniref:Helix-turn-helix domain-containing protein n=1 Tax=Gordonia jinghuaiqii TaxID=2758710 RepID=A0A7D7LYV1_9ACTN|nr:helix-turn-helix domain-containing protein [Gordonia jinghuaiqii]MCR5977530.1 helix-turn-helix domain-containing protein [Gordonia jinghuaiqii]QMT02216.1 helix-turn-helix domain-containing protein [Gordonia jinghuaiqii]
MTHGDDRRRTVGTRIATLRTRRGMSLSALAREAGIGKGSLSELEAGQRNPTLDTLYAVAGPLGVPLTALLGQESGAEGASPYLAARLLHVEHVPDAGTVEVFWLQVTPGGVRESPAHGPGVVEHVHVVSGHLVAGRVGEERTAGPGHSLQWISDVPHTYRSDDGALAVLTIRSPETPAG